MDPSQLYPFIAASVVFVAIPGANTVYIVTCAVDNGRRAGILSALGVEAGTLVHVAVAVAGLAAVMAAFPLALTAVKIAGGGYLLYLGLQVLRRSAATEAATVTGSAWKLFRDGLIVNVGNPKVALFFLAFLPQFVTDQTAARPQMLLLGCVFFALALLLDLVYAVAGGALGGWLSDRPRVRNGQRYAVATVYLALGGWACATAVW